MSLPHEYSRTWYTWYVTAILMKIYTAYIFWYLAYHYVSSLSGRVLLALQRRTLIKRFQV